MTWYDMVWHGMHVHIHAIHATTRVNPWEPNVPGSSQAPMVGVDWGWQPQWESSNLGVSTESHVDMKSYEI